MFKNYFITAFRNFKKNKSYTLLNVIGLGIGLASCLFVFTIINFEHSFDDWHSKKDRTYRVVKHYFGDNRTYKSGIIPYTTGDALIANIPDLEKVVQFHGPNAEKMRVQQDEGNLSVFREDYVLYTDPNFFDVLDFELVKGSQAQIAEPFKVFLTPELAKKYYGDENPLGRIITNSYDEHLEVVGIIAPSPDNTNLPYDMIISMATLRKRLPDVFQSEWNMTWAYSTYVLLPPGASILEIERKMTEIVASHADEDDQDKIQMKLQPLTSIHTDEQYGDGTHYVTPSMMMHAFALIGFLLLGTACLNFINLNTAQAVKRSKEIGIRKTLGSYKYQLIIQFLLETFLVVTLSMLLAFTLGQILIHQFNSFLSIIQYNLGYDPTIILFAAAMTVVVTLLAGGYPSMVLAGYQPIAALHNQINLRKGSGSINLRRALVIAQFVFTNIMLICTLIIASQMNYIKTKDLGFETENIATMELPNVTMDKYETFKNAFLNKSYVKDATLAYEPPQSSSNWNNSYKHIGQDYEDGNNANMKFCDENYMEFYGIELIAGQNIQNQNPNDSTDHVVVNLKLIQTLGWDSPDEAIGQWFENSNKVKIIGVMENFNVWSLHHKISPAMILYSDQNIDELNLKFHSEDIEAYLPDMKATFQAHFPGELFEFSLLENDLQDNYIIEGLLHKVIQFVAILAIILSAIGLYGLVSFMASQNAKTIGIRKVFGASTASLLAIFGKEYGQLLVIAFIISIGPAWYLMQIWIEEFTYRIDITYAYFLGGLSISLLLTLLTVGYKSYKAAIANPVDSLRYE